MDLIAKKYRVLKTLGQGAMGEVFLVLPPRGEPVALKLLKTGEASGQKSAVEQFENEFKVLKKLSHPNIGKIFDYGYDPELKKVYFTSPWLKGCDLFAATKDLPYQKVEEYFVQMLRALNYLHQKGIIHCDLKPGNVFVENGNILLIDFGLAGYWGESIVGTPTYLAPEIFRGEHHNVSSDLYAVGVILYNCLTRTQPFSGKALQEVYDRHRTKTPPPLTELNQHVPKYMSDIALTLLAKKPSDRYSSAAAVIEEISAYAPTKYTVETSETLLSYLPNTSELIGRAEVQWKVDELFGSFLSDKPRTPYTAIFLAGEHGAGKTKFISQIVTRLQLAKVLVEHAQLPLTESDQKVFQAAEAIILEDVDNFTMELPAFLSFLEQKILSPETNRLLLVVTGTDRSQWDSFAKLFPEETLTFESLTLSLFTESETKIFLENVIGQSGIPDKFISQIYRNTGGNPRLCQQLIQGLIEQGLLFDESGRWSADLMAHLEEILKKLETPRSLTDRLELEYQSLNEDEKKVLHWLVVCPHGLTQRMLKRLIESDAIGEILEHLLKKQVIRLEEETYTVYRPVLIPFVQKLLSPDEQRRLHERLAFPDLGLEQVDVWYHQSLGGNPVEVQEALELLGQEWTHRGEKEKALECYQRLQRLFINVPLPQRVDWGVKASELLIWLDRFSEAENLLTSLESEIMNDASAIPITSQLVLWEKKGLALLHQNRTADAADYFKEGLALSASHEKTRVEQIRFLNDLAQIEVIQGQPEGAILRFDEARKMAAHLSKSETQKITNNDLGHVYYRLKDYDRAIATLKEDAKIFAALPTKEPLARALYSLAESYRALKKMGKAVDEYESCIDICKQENLLPILLRSYNGLGNVLMVEGKYDDALKTYQRAVEISVRLKDVTTKAALLANQGLIYKNQGNLVQASRRFLLAKQILEAKESKISYDDLLLAKCYSELTVIAREEKNSLKALSYQVEKIRLISQSKSLKADEFSSKIDLAELYLENRLEEPLTQELDKLELIAKSDEEKKNIDELRQRWKEIQGFDQDKTSKVDREVE